MASQGTDRLLLRTLEGPAGVAQIYQVTPPGKGIGELNYEVEFAAEKRLFLTIGEAVLEAEALVMPGT